MLNVFKYTQKGTKWSNKKSSKTYHEDVICVWNLASGSEEFTKVVELDRMVKNNSTDTFLTASLN